MKYIVYPHFNDSDEVVTIKQFKDIPFTIKRIFYMYDTIDNVTRGYHAHRNVNQILVCISGSCKIRLDNGFTKKVFDLTDHSRGLYLPVNVWLEMYEFTSDAILLVLASDLYDEKEYIRNYDEFLKLVQ
ncbi:MAG: FdtA/QdtA family cupin domain-containing protein [Selenomonadaceae bacterium]|nr:FdtA/QdtA family cupin domain-containing protein [Selenomonadaceae bacterium]